MSDDDENMSDNYEAQERVIRGGMLGITGQEEQKGQSNKTPKDLFISNIHIIGLDIIQEQNQTILTSSDLTFMEEAVELLHGIQYKNPSAYILGYIGCNNGGEITKQALNRAYKLMDIIRDKSVQQPDIIRYARLWTNVLIPKLKLL
jgi:hypothetical protein